MRTENAGVTLIEMLVVVAIIGLFAAMTIPNFMRRFDKTKVDAARVQIVDFEQALAHCKLDIGVYPATEQGLEALHTRPANVANWDGPYLLKEIPLDPWRHPYLYRFPGEHGVQPEI